MRTLARNIRKMVWRVRHRWCATEKSMCTLGTWGRQRWIWKGKMQGCARASLRLQVACQVTWSGQPKNQDAQEKWVRDRKVRKKWGKATTSKCWNRGVWRARKESAEGLEDSVCVWVATGVAIVYGAQGCSSKGGPGSEAIWRALEGVAEFEEPGQPGS